MLDAFFQCLYQPRFTDAGFPAQQYDLPGPVFDPLPPVLQQTVLVLTANEWREPLSCNHLKATLRLALFRYTIKGQWHRDAFEFWLPAIFTDKQAFYQAIGRGTDQHLIRLGSALDAGSDVRRLP